jgi:hypothetical protein
MISSAKNMAGIKKLCEGVACNGIRACYDESRVRQSESYLNQSDHSEQSNRKMKLVR